MISNIIIIFFLKVFFFQNLFAQEKFEGMIVSIDKEIITTYDLSQRIKLALKSLNLEDSISNRDSVRERMLELQNSADYIVMAAAVSDLKIKKGKNPSKISKSNIWKCYRFKL